MTSSNGIIFRVTGPLCGEFTGPGEFPTQRPVTRSFDVIFDLRLNKRLSKQPWGWWFVICPELWATQRARDAIITVTMSTRRRWRRVDVGETLSFRHYCVMCQLGSESHTVLTKTCSVQSFYLLFLAEYTQYIKTEPRTKDKAKIQTLYSLQTIKNDDKEGRGEKLLKVYGPITCRVSTFQSK